MEEWMRHIPRCTCHCNVDKVGGSLESHSRATDGHILRASYIYRRSSVIYR